MNHVTQKIITKKKNGIPITMVTAYDYPTARLEELAGVDVVLVGDSVGTNVLGYESERDVTMADMLHHLKAVKRGAPECCIMVDLPYGSATDSASAYENSRRLCDTGANIVKIEGWGEKASIVSYLTGKGIDVCSHIGYNPQYHGSKGRIFGKDAAAAVELIQSARSLEEAGAVMLIAEKVPEEVGKIIAERCTIPVIGIGSGRFCDGQVLVFHDIIGLGWRTFRHAKTYAEVRQVIAAALQGYTSDVENRHFPGEEHGWRMAGPELEELLRMVGSEG